jgi:hypothetical protein
MNQHGILFALYQLELFETISFVLNGRRTGSIGDLEALHVLLTASSATTALKTLAMLILCK